MRVPLQDFRHKTAIVGIGYSRSPNAPGGFSKNSGESVLTLAVRAAKEACADAGIEPSQLNGGIMYGLNDSVAPNQVLAALGAKDVFYAINMTGGGNYPSLVTTMAAEAVQHGMVDYCLVYRAMNGRSGVRMGQLGGGAGGGSNRVGDGAQFTSIYGLAGPPSGYAFEARRYMEVYGATSEDLGAWAVNGRVNATKNPRAMMQAPITLEDHQNSRFIVKPYHLLDCCLETDVAAAMIVTTVERARALRKTPVLIAAGSGSAGRSDEIADGGLLRIRDRMLQGAGIELKDIDTFHPYDNFSDCPMRLLEDMGWCGRGEAGAFVREGRATLDGEIPVSTQGGLMSEGYAHGMNNILEAVQQVRGEAEDLCPNWAKGEHTYDRSICRQVRDVNISMHTSVSGSGALILKKG